MKRIRWGVIGSGGIARRRTIPEGILPASNSVLAAVYGPTPQVNQEVARQFNARAAASVEELLAAEIDAVYIASPADAHAAQVQAAAAAGKHVLCEKPLGLSVAEAQTMVAACERAGVNLGTAFMMCFHSQHQAMAALIREGRLGQPVYARAQLSCWYPPIAGAWRQDPHRGGGGALMDMGGHCLDLLELLLGELEHVTCQTRAAVHPYPVEDTAVVLGSCRSGVLITVDTCFCIPDRASQNRLEIYGSAGSLLARGTIGQGEAGEVLAFLEGGTGAYEAQQSRAAQHGVPLCPPPVNMYRAEIEAFAQAILEGKDTRDSARAGLRSQQVLAACYESARTGQRVSVA